jgi:hypothetical protein
MNIAVDCRMIDASEVNVYLRKYLPYVLDSPITHSGTLGLNLRTGTMNCADKAG